MFSYPFSMVGPPIVVDSAAATVQITHFIHHVKPDKVETPTIKTLNPPALGFTGMVVLIGDEPVSESGVGPVVLAGPAEGATNIGWPANLTPGFAQIMVFDGELWWPNQYA